MTAAHADPPRLDFVLIQVPINSLALIAVLITGYEVDLISEATARKCNLVVYWLVQFLPQRFAEVRRCTRTDKTMCIKCQLDSEMGHITLVHFYAFGASNLPARLWLVHGGRAIVDIEPLIRACQALPIFWPFSVVMLFGR